MQILTKGYPKGDNVILDSITCTYFQEDDCVGSCNGDYQEITIKSEDGGGGKFLHIKTDGWSITGLEDLIPLIMDFEHRMNYECNDNSGSAREKVLEENSI